MQTTYGQAEFEPTGISWTLASQDRYWAVFYYDDSENQPEAYRHSRVFLGAVGDPDSYDLIDPSPVFTRRSEAEAFAQVRRDWLDSRGLETQIFVINLGDDARWERAILGMASGHRDEKVFLTRGRFRGSDAALAELNRRWKLLWPEEFEAL